jgi:hypothetical protein
MALAFHFASLNKIDSAAAKGKEKEAQHQRSYVC